MFLNILVNNLASWARRVRREGWLYGWDAEI